LELKKNGRKYYTLDENNNVIVDFESIGDQLKRAERELLELTKQEE
jgi:hypothetical protein